METIGTVVIGSIHLLAVIAWLGGAILLDRIWRPASKTLEPPQAGMLNMMMGQRFTIWAWSAAGILILTGVVRAAALGAFSPDVLFGTAYGAILLTKIALVVVIVVFGILSLQQGRLLGQLTAAKAPPQEFSPAAGRLRTYQLVSIWVGIAVVILAVALRVVGLED